MYRSLVSAKLFFKTYKFSAYYHSTDASWKQKRQLPLLTLFFACNPLKCSKKQITIFSQRFPLPRRKRLVPFSKEKTPWCPLSRRKWLDALYQRENALVPFIKEKTPRCPLPRRKCLGALYRGENASVPFTKENTPRCPLPRRKCLGALYRGENALVPFTKEKMPRCPLLKKNRLGASFIPKSEASGLLSFFCFGLSGPFVLHAVHGFVLLWMSQDPEASYDVNGGDNDPQPRYDYSNENRCCEWSP